jgi:hypothetical protein
MNFCMRRDTRTICGLNVRLVLPEGKAISCRIGNISRGGALLLVPEANFLPAEFALYDIFARTTRSVVPVWSGDGCVGVKFLDRPASLRSGFDRSKRQKTEFGKRQN